MLDAKQRARIAKNISAKKHTLAREVVELSGQIFTDTALKFGEQLAKAIRAPTRPPNF